MQDSAPPDMLTMRLEGRQGHRPYGDRGCKHTGNVSEQLSRSDSKAGTGQAANSVASLWVIITLSKTAKGSSTFNVDDRQVDSDLKFEARYYIPNELDKVARGWLEGHFDESEQIACRVTA